MDVGPIVGFSSAATERSEPTSVPLERATQLLDHGPVTLITTAWGGCRNVMAAAWAMPFDFVPLKLVVVVDRSTFTRELIDASGEFGLQLPTRAMAGCTLAVGHESGRNSDKFSMFGIETFAAREIAAPMVVGCAAWLECRVIPDASQKHDLILAEIVAAYADPRSYRDNRWVGQEDALNRTMHYVAGGQFFSTGDAFTATATLARDDDRSGATARVPALDREGECTS